MTIIRYTHHDVSMAVREDLQGQHRAHCLCYGCIHFAPGNPANCVIASALYKFDQEHAVVTPVWECRWFEERKSQTG